MGKTGHGGWSQERVDAIRAMLLENWIGPGRAAIALDRHRGTIHNHMRTGKLRTSCRGGSRYRSVSVADVLRQVLSEIDVDLAVGSHMGACSSELVDDVRQLVELANERERTGERTNEPANTNERTRLG